MVEMAILPAKGALLDVGGGTGRMAAALADLASMVIVADLSIDMLEQARNKGVLQTVCSHSEKLPFADGDLIGSLWSTRCTMSTIRARLHLSCGECSSLEDVSSSRSRIFVSFR